MEETLFFAEAPASFDAEFLKTRIEDIEAKLAKEEEKQRSDIRIISILRSTLELNKSLYNNIQ